MTDSLIHMYARTCVYVIINNNGIRKDEEFLR